MVHTTAILVFTFLLANCLTAQTDATQIIRGIVINETCPSAERSANIREVLKEELQYAIDEYIQIAGKFLLAQ